MTGHRQTRLADSRPARACLWREASSCWPGWRGFCRSWFLTFCRVQSSTWISSPHWSCSPGPGPSRSGESVWARSPALVHRLLVFHSSCSFLLLYFLFSSLCPSSTLLPSFSLFCDESWSSFRWSGKKRRWKCMKDLQRSDGLYWPLFW